MILRSFFIFTLQFATMVTLKELAKMLNISVSTVSKALNDSHEISEITKKRVKELADKLNYKPNRIAQQLKSNQTRTVGVILPTVTNPFFAEVLHGIESAATKNDYDIIVCLSNETLFKEKRSLELLANGSVDGFILAVARESQVQNHTAHLQKVIDNNIPMLLFDRVMENVDCNKIIVDDYQSVYDATLHLIKKEKRSQVLLLSNIEELSVGKLRINGYTEAMQSQGLKPKVLRLSHSDDVEQSILKYLAEHPSTDAIVSIDHITGIIAINMAKKLGKNIPEDLSVIGFGYENTPLLSDPKISLVHQMAFKIGKMAMDLIIESITNTDTELKTIVIPSELEFNQTTLSK